jgi:hypothetical protein
MAAIACQSYLSNFSAMTIIPCHASPLHLSFLLDFSALTAISCQSLLPGFTAIPPPLANPFYIPDFSAMTAISCQSSLLK